MKENAVEVEKEYVHEWFELTYSSYLVIPRSILQSMPTEWQKKFVELLDEVKEATSHLTDLPGNYWVRAKNSKGEFIHDPYKEYDRGRRIVKLNACGYAGVDADKPCWGRVRVSEEDSPGNYVYLCEGHWDVPLGKPYKEKP